MTAADRLYVWVGVNLTAAPTTNTTAELDIEGTSGGNYDSLVVVPLPKRPTINSLSPAAAPVGASVSVSGSNFGATQGTSTITFNGVAASPTSWGDGAIVAPVPAGATTGPVVVTAGGTASNGVPFTVGEIGAITGTITRAADGAALAGAQVQALQSGAVKGTATSDAAGAYSIASLLTGQYDVAASAPGHEPQTRTEQQVNAPATTTVNFGLGTAFIKYVYDEAGRLVGVINTNGDAATYVYDSVGNLTAITRQTSAQTSIIEFTPRSGPVGTTVTIYGTGFSETPAQNTVKFNGVTAQVASATKTQIVTSVPAAATTGPVSVTTPSGTATSSKPFTVGSGSAPTITGFTPQVGGESTSVTINGTNFHTTPSNNKVSFNGVRAVTNSATATTITTTVPALAKSGRISVTTPDGRGVSSTDFFIPPPPYTGAEVESTTRIAFGESKAVAVNTPDKVAMILFDAPAGQRMSLSVSAVGIPGSTVVRIYRPDNILQISTSVSQGGSVFIDTQILPDTGTYTIIVDPPTGSTGGLTLSLHDANDAVSAITPGGPAVTASVSTPGQRSRLNFTGTAGQRVSLNLGSNTIPGSTSVFLVKPDGTNLTSTSLSQNGTQFVDALTLPAAGTYSVLVDPSGANAGGMSVQLYDVQDNAGPITPGGPPVTVTTTVPGQNRRLTFTGSFGQSVSLNFSANSIPATTSVYLIKPDGTTLTSSSLGQNGTRYIDAVTLPAPGTYTVLVDPSSTNTGSMTVQLNDATDVPGQNARVSFAGSEGQRVSLNVSAVTVAGTNVTIQNPDGTQLATVFSGTGGAFIDAQTLPAAGTYTVLVDPSTTSTGSATLTLYDVPSDEAGTITAGGAAVTVTAGAPGQNPRLTFPGVPGQRISLNASGNTIPSSTRVYLLRPDGGTITSVSVGQNSTGYIDAQVLPVAGTYAVLVDPSTSNTGNMTVQLNDSSDVDGGTIMPGGPPVTVTTSQAGQNARLTFTGTTGQRVSLNVTGVSISSGTVYVYNPDGSALVNGTGFGTGGAFIDTRTLPVTGTYTIIVDPSTTSTGSATLTLYDVPPDDAGAITPGGAAVTVSATVPGQNQRLTFAGSFGQKVSVNMSGNSIPGSTSVAIVKPDGTNLASQTISLNGTGYIDAQTLPITGTYTLLVNPPTVNTGSMTVQLVNADDPAAGTITPGGPPVTVTTSAAGQNARLTFTGSAGRRVSLNVSGVTMSSGSVLIQNPNGTTLATASFGTGGVFIDAQTLPAGGTYAILLDPSGTSVGSATLQLHDVPSDDAGPITPGGPAVTVSSTVPGQNQRLAFAGGFGQRVSLSLSANTASGSTSVVLVKPDGTNLASTSVGLNGTGYVDAQSLPTPGTYTVLVNPSGTNTGNMTVKLNDASEQDAGAITPGGPAAAASVTQPGQTARLTFSGTAGQQIALQVTGNTMSTVSVTIINPDGSVLATQSSSAAGFNLATLTLPTSGTFIIRIDPSGTNTGEMSATLTGQ